MILAGSYTTGKSQAGYSLNVWFKEALSFTVHRKVFTLESKPALRKVIGRISAPYIGLREAKLNYRIAFGWDF